MSKRGSLTSRVDDKVPSVAANRDRGGVRDVLVRDGARAHIWLRTKSVNTTSVDCGDTLVSLVDEVLRRLDAVNVLQWQDSSLDLRLDRCC